MINPYLIQQNAADTQTKTTIAPFDHRTNSRVKTNATCSQPAMNNPQMFTANPNLISSNTNANLPVTDTLVPRTDMMVLSLGEMVPDMPLPETLTDSVFVPGFLATQIGKLMRVEFLIGNQITDRVGRLVGVGASYILLAELSGSSTIMCDLFSIKFVTIINSNPGDALVIT